MKDLPKLEKETLELFKRARTLAGISTEEACRLTGVKSVAAYRARENDPYSFRLEELLGLYISLSHSGKKLITHALSKIFYTSR